MQCACMTCCFIVKALANDIMQRKLVYQLGQNHFDMFRKIDCWAVTRDRIWMNNVPRGGWNDYAIIPFRLITVLWYLLSIWEIWVWIWVSLFWTHTVDSRLSFSAFSVNALHSWSPFLILFIVSQISPFPPPPPPPPPSSPLDDLFQSWHGGRKFWGKGIVMGFLHV